MARSINRFGYALVGTALAALVASAAWSAAAPGKLAAPATPAEQLFPDAPYGVDAMVTGPVSTAFKQRQAAAGCDKATWPEIPAQCYPHR